ncbi:heat shock protein 9/12-domain-containing protein [Crucibulum laeve]|uniref:Heat shock protein 9/12-domain-containing protein n=1 Tax=Crucibulum laeve TaxID=68775 RepID=A0A5C3MCP2_9AGAR|nr:heat shock protein 9/12-domain-containing protein [Crucibulum laeve]
MSEAGRQSFTDKAGAALKPDSQKSTTEQAGDFLKGKSDSAASTVQPNSHKSATQQVGDSVSGNQNHNQESILDKAKNAVGLGEK